MRSGQGYNGFILFKRGEIRAGAVKGSPPAASVGCIRNVFPKVGGKPDKPTGGLASL
ncbi:hypothetical protein ALO95_200180 [Pseudomonas syringae pv. antirrhini]|nr:hypothetical protein ALQ23_200279 [Pseudomonas syringae pv. antirrhini]RMW26009.1 hypothetical protein ALO95_200180 [Pseudomonas syringae pv. antirrhini]